MKHFERLLFGLLIVLCIASWFASGKVAALAFGLCWFVGATFAAVKGFRAVITGELTVIPGWSEFSNEKPITIDRKDEPTRFWLHLSVVFLVAAAAIAYGIYAWPVI